MLKIIISFLKDIYFIEENSISYNLCFIDKSQHYKKELPNFLLDKVYIWAIYWDFLQKDLKNLKYRYNTKSLENFLEIYWELFNKYCSNLDKENLIITWVPLFFINRIFRGFDHIDFIIKLLIKDISIDYCKLVKKNKLTKHQAGLSREKRLTNLKNSFKFNYKYSEKIRGKTIILLDDVISSWTTVNEITYILKQNWAKEVIWLFLASGN